MHQRKPSPSHGFYRNGINEGMLRNTVASLNKSKSQCARPKRALFSRVPLDYKLSIFYVHSYNAYCTSFFLFFQVLLNNNFILRLLVLKGTQKRQAFRLAFFIRYEIEIIR